MARRPVRWHIAVFLAPAVLVYTAISDIKVFGLAALLIGVGMILYAVNVFAKRSLDHENPEP